MNDATRPVPNLHEPIADTIASDMRAIVVMLLHADTKNVVLDSALLLWDMDPEEKAQRIWWELATHYGIGCKSSVVQVADRFEPTIRIRMVGDIIEDRADGWDAPLLWQLLVHRRHAKQRRGLPGLFCVSTKEHAHLA